MNIKQVLEHNWLQKFECKQLTQKRRLSKIDESNFVIYSSTTDTK
jgi:hypothetical protein